MNTETKSDQKTYNYFHKEVYKKYVRAGITVDYYGSIAADAKAKMMLCNFVSLAASSSAAYVFFQHQSDIAAFLALVAAIASIINVVSGWSSEESRFLDAQSRARSWENGWEILWRKIDSEYKVDLDKISAEMDDLGRQYADFQQRIQPHNQKKRRVSKIQDRVERSLKEKEENDE